MYPHTTHWENGHAVTSQGHEYIVAARQGGSFADYDNDAGFAYFRYERKDTDPTYEPSYLD